jgi:cytochrome b
MTRMQQNTVKVWDPLVRIFHWSLVAGFSVAYLSGEIEGLTLHVWSGYLVGGLILFRLLWGFIGTEHARFHDFVYSPAVVVAYARDLLRHQARRYLGHNPLGGAMVVALLVLIALATATGLVVYATDKQSGPLAGLLGGAPDWLNELAEETHEFLSNLALLLVGLHIAGVFVSSALHRENLVRAMITGRKRV